ncbi:MAG: sigma-70 family RNA polymerase sigma factor [candidate division Zixibacteria bacterium]|nr:sigma-70 family RNA polymerase sigma factor [candidate division Zixibacteria bacterium]
MASSRTDIELWQDILAGDNAAWNDLVRRYQALVYAVVTRAGLSMADTADCFQQTWVLLFRHRHRLHDPSRLSAWLVTTAKREALRLRRRADRESGDPVKLDSIAPDPLPDEALEQLERQAQLEIALKELDPRCRQVVEALFFAPEERSYEEIARDFGLSANSLGPVRRRCLERLKQILADRDFIDVRKKDDGSL